MKSPTVEQLIEQIAHQFLQVDLDYGHGTDNAWDEAAWVVHHVLELDYAGPVTQYQDLVANQALEEAFKLANLRIASRKPLAYLTHKMWFAGIEFYVDERVLVPRSPIAELIQARFEPWLDSSQIVNVLDLCTGSGCIALAIAMHMPETRVTATDISSEALEVAKINQSNLLLEDQVKLLEADLFSGIPHGTYDLIISNPPYVDAEDMSMLAMEYQHEPELGLASGEDGLVHVKRILADAGRYLSDEGCIIVEVGNSMPALQEAFPKVPFIWIEFASGGDGVFMLSAKELKEHFA